MASGPDELHTPLMPLTALNAQPRSNSVIAIIMVNYNTGHLVAQSLATLTQVKAKWPGLRLVVVDNASPDHSADQIEQQADALGITPWVQVARNPVNGGFAMGNNFGVRAAQSTQAPPPDFYFFLNPDTLVDPDVLDHLMSFSERQADLAVLGCTLMDVQHRTRSSAFRFPGLVSEFQRSAAIGLIDRMFPNRVVALPVGSQPYRADWLTGAGFFMSTQVLAQVGPMDEGYFLYYEEVDYMHKIRDMGIQIWSLPQARIVHIAGAATGIVGGKSQKKRMPLYWYGSWRRYFTKHHGVVGAWACGLAWMAGLAANRVLSLVSPKRRGSQGGPSAKDFLMYALLGKSAPRP
jgi:N-acetylglucosaminyl-diphospho-decaprenol L-rhamnosyltransferase